MHYHCVTSTSPSRQARRDSVDLLHRARGTRRNARTGNAVHCSEVSDEVSADYGPYQSLSAGDAESDTVDAPVTVVRTS